MENQQPHWKTIGIRAGVTGFVAGLILIANLAVAAESSLATVGTHSHEIAAGGYQRTFVVHVPPKYDGIRRVPLVLMLHGAGGAGKGAMADYGWVAKADAEGFVVVAPDALPARPAMPSNFFINPRFWNDSSGRGSAIHQAVDDVGFVRSLIETLQSQLAIDHMRIFVTGFSSGASMTHHLGVQLSDELAAIAPVSGHLFHDTTQLKRPISMMLIAGSSDPLNPLNGGPARAPWGGTHVMPSMQESVLKWVKLDGCQMEPNGISDENGVRKISYSPCGSGGEVVFYTIEGQGHVWPGGVNHLPKRLVGEEAGKMDATEVIWDFFRSHPRKD
jgi:polyhydroxybutyrate depolymerase